MVDVEQPIAWDILADLPVGGAVDPGCGTGGHTAQLAALGHRVIGVERSPEMLAVDRDRLPDSVFHLGDLHRHPTRCSSFLADRLQTDFVSLPVATRS